MGEPTTEPAKWKRRSTAEYKHNKVTFRFDSTDNEKSLALCRLLILDFCRLFVCLACVN